MKEAIEELYSWYCNQARTRTGDEYHIGMNEGGKEALERLYKVVYGDNIKENHEQTRRS